MNRLDSVLSQRAARRRAPALCKILVLPIVVALVLLAVALTMAALPPTTAEAATYLVCFCEPETPTTETPTTEPGPTLARPRVVKAGKDINGGELVPGDEILWTVTVKNLGDKLTSIVVTDSVPEGTTYVDGSIEGSGADDSGCPKLTWAVDALKCGERVTVSFRTRVDDGVAVGTLITNQASADSAQTPPGVSGAVTLKVTGSSVLPTEEISVSSTSTTIAGLDTVANEDAFRRLIQAFLGWWFN